MTHLYVTSYSTVKNWKLFLWLKGHLLGPLLFTMVLEVLAIEIRKEKLIKDIQIERKLNFHYLHIIEGYGEQAIIYPQNQPRQYFWPRVLLGAGTWTLLPAPEFQTPERRAATQLQPHWFCRHFRPREPFSSGERWKPTSKFPDTNLSNRPLQKFPGLSLLCCRFSAHYLSNLPEISS